MVPDTIDTVFGHQKHGRSWKLWKRWKVLTLLVLSYTREKLEKGHNGPKSETVKCYRTLLSSNKVNVNYIATSTFLRTHPLFLGYIVHFSRLFQRVDKLIFGSYNNAIASSRCFIKLLAVINYSRDILQHFAITSFGSSYPLSGFSLLILWPHHAKFLEMILFPLRKSWIAFVARWKLYIYYFRASEMMICWIHTETDVRRTTFCNQSEFWCS